MRRILGLSAAAVALVALMSPGIVLASGPSDWRYNPETRHSYAIVENVTWADGEALAIRLGGHLATVDNQAEQDWLTATWPDPWIWIGLNDRATEGRYVWSSGTRVRFTAWQGVDPDDWKGFDPIGEDATVLNGDAPGWHTISERWLLNGIVEVPGRPKDLAANTLPWGTHDGTVDDPAFFDACYANGWAFDSDSPSRNVTVRILAQRLDIFTVPVEVWRGPAGEFRQDLLDAGIGDGTSGFWVDLRPMIAWGLPYEIRAQGRDVQTGEWFTLDASPRTLTCHQF